jgi:hypothetical protein
MRCQVAPEDGEDVGGSTRASQAIEGALGVNRRNGVLAALYLARSDSSSVVRQKALQVQSKLIWTRLAISCVVRVCDIVRQYSDAMRCH